MAERIIISMNAAGNFFFSMNAAGTCFFYANAHEKSILHLIHVSILGSQLVEHVFANFLSRT